MCALCGAFGAAEHWTDGTRQDRGLPAFVERRARAATANRVLALHGVRLAAWGDRYTLTSRTGRTVILDSFGALWQEAERLTGKECDPLDLKTIAAVEGLADSP